MPKKTFTPEQIVPKLRQIEVLIGQGKMVPLACKEAGGAAGRCWAVEVNVDTCNTSSRNRTRSDCDRTQCCDRSWSNRAARALASHVIRSSDENCGV